MFYRFKIGLRLLDSTVGCCCIFMLEVLHACCYRTVVLIRKEAVRNRERGGKPSLQTSCSWPVLEVGGWTFLNALRSHRVMQNVTTHQPTVEAFQTAWPSVVPVHSFTQPALTNTVLASLAGNSKNHWWASGQPQASQPDPTPWLAPLPLSSSPGQMAFPSSWPAIQPLCTTGWCRAGFKCPYVAHSWPTSGQGYPAESLRSCFLNAKHVFPLDLPQG